jgi:nucleoside-diphosphate-sugar epimerase
MKLFVTGMTGFLGRAIVEQAGLAGHEVVGIDVTAWPDDAPVPPHAHFVQAAMDDAAIVRSLLDRCDVLIHTAGLHMKHHETANLGDYIHTNVELSARLLDAAHAAGVGRYVIASSLMVVLGRRFLNAQHLPPIIREDTPPPVGVAYSISKLTMEVAAREWARLHDVPLALLRFCGFGHKSTPEGEWLLTIVMSARDAARACLCAMQRNEARGEVYHITSGTPLTESDVRLAMTDPHAALERRFPGAVEILERQGCEIAAKYFHPNFPIDKARRELGYEPIDTFENWLRQHGWQPTASPSCPTKP